MASKYQFITALYDETSKDIVHSSSDWQAFLTSACRNFRLRFDEQILVYAQRPDAVAVLELEDWNKRFHRWVNRNSKGIAVFEDAERSRQRLKHYFDISDTHEGYNARQVPIFDMKPEYEQAVIETLESTFGELENKSNLAQAIISASENAVEDNLPDYLDDLLRSREDSFLEELDDHTVKMQFQELLKNSVQFMLMKRLGIDVDEYFVFEDFLNIVSFNTKHTLNAIGYATSDIAEMGLTEISRTVYNLKRDAINKNRTFAEQKKTDYNVVENKTERSFEDDRNHIQPAGRLSTSQSDLAETGRSSNGQVRNTSQEIPEGEAQSNVLQPSDGLQTERTSEPHSGSGNRDGGSISQENGADRGNNRGAESNEYDGVGALDEQHQERSAGSGIERTDLQLEYYDRKTEDKSLPFFGGDKNIHSILLTTPHLKASKDEIRAFFENNQDNNVRTEYIKSIFNNDYTELIVGDDKRVGYKTFQNVLHLWEGTYENKTAQSYYDWGVIAEHFEGLRLLGELYDTSKPIPSIGGQMSFMESLAEEKPSAFVFSQEIIDRVLARGSNIQEGKMRIYHQFQKSLSKAENVAFLKHEYGWGGSYPIIIGTGIDEMHDGKGMMLQRGFEKNDPRILLKWDTVEKRIGELIRMDRYLNSKEKEYYPEWLVKKEERDRAVAEELRNKQILSTAPVEKEPEPQKEYEYHLGDKVYLGAEEYEILAFDEQRVELYDLQYPLFHKEFTRDEFDKRVQENPMNDHLLVEKLPAGEENTDKADEEQDVRFQVELTSDAFEEPFIIRDTSVPETNDGRYYDVDGIYQTYTDEAQAQEVADKLNGIEPEITEVSYDYLIGKELTLDDSKFIVESISGSNASLRDVSFENSVGFPINRVEPLERVAALVEEAEKAQVFLAPPNKKSKSKVKTFDIHPDIPMADRHNFNLAENEVEEVGKKERFKRNMEAIRVLQECEFENRFATPEEQIILSKYVGWGGLPEAFDENNSAWADEFVELYTTLSPDDYSAARESTLTAFYTPPAVIKSIYKAMEQMGFKEGNILEPSCGIGHFIGVLPDSMKESKMYGVELDNISAKIAQQLYQKASIAAQPFEEASLPDSFFDAVVGNVPFGDFKVSDKRYDKHKFLIHDYFFAKSLDKLRPNGVMALVTSKGTMDKENCAVRKYIAQRADLLGAIRLPNNTFKGNAGTEVVSDILFLQKRDRLIDIEPDWVHLGKDENGISMNSYFIEHPEMVLGNIVMESGRFGPEATCKPFENANLDDLLEEAITNIHGEITEAEIDDELVEEDNSIPADPTVRNFSYTIADGKVYFRENSRMTPIEVAATAENRIKGLIGIRDCVRTLIEMQTEDYPDYEIKQEQERLNSLYDSFSAKYGLINSRANTSAFSSDSSFSLIAALEVIGDEGELERKADMFYKRTIKPHIPITSCDTPSEALAVSMGEKAQIDIEYMCQLTGKTENEIFEELKGVIFLNPLYEYGTHTQAKYLMADEYLSGNVREKLKTAKNSAAVYPEDYTINVEALEKVQPKELNASEISVRLGATWIPPDVVEQFVYEFLQTPRYAQWNIKVHFSQYTGEWNMEGKSYDRSNIRAYSTYGTSRINAYKIIEETLNLKDVRIFDYVEDDEGRKKAVLNKKETAIAQSKQELIKQGFQDWVWKEPERRERLCKIYNEKFNSTRPREYDGSHITFSGMNPEIKLRKHQVNAIAHILYGGNTLLAHAVGAGKTYEMVAAAQESKRLGLCNKSLFVVPNHLTEQWASEYLQLYPSANILVATKKDFETKNRKKFCGRIATGDYDAVIIGHSQFEKIPMSIERQRAILEQQLEEITTGISELKHNRGENFSVKQLEKSRKSIKLKLEKLNDQSRKDDVVTFEELGVDRLFIDESHYFKNLFLYTKMRNVGGIAQTEAQKSSDLFMKCRYLDELTGGRGTIFATGTPISNSMVELYTIQRYLQYKTLAENNLQHFDAWASTFGETITAIELTPEGTGYRAKTRFAKFYNLPELISMFKEVADIQTADMLNLPVPEAHYHNVAVKPSEIQTEMVAGLAERADKIRGGMVDSSIDNMLKITNDGRKLALDQRLMNDMLPDDEGSKVNACIDNVFRIWEENKEKKSAQLVFCDLSTPKNDGSFSVYDDIRKKLIERGVPAEEIKFIHEADTETKKQELFKKVRKGDVRVLLGSTQKMGAGTNVQNKLIALHDVDCPWRPSDLEQRSGRIIRQGNENPAVDIYRYVTEQTFDSYLYQLVEGKQKFASQIYTSKSPVRSAEDIDETALSYAEIKMLATGNPHIKEKMDLDIQVQKLKLLKSSFLSEKYALEDKIIKYYPQEITRRKGIIQGLQSDIECVKAHPKPTDDRFVGMTVKGVFFNEKADAGQALIEACKSMTSPDAAVPIGQYRGFDMDLIFESISREYVVKVKGKLTHAVPLGSDVHGNITRLDNALDGLEKRLAVNIDELENTEKQFETAKSDVEKPFSKDEELQQKQKRLNELNSLLNVDKRENEMVDGEPDEGDCAPTRNKDSRER